MNREVLIQALELSANMVKAGKWHTEDVGIFLAGLQKNNCSFAQMQDIHSELSFNPNQYIATILDRVLK